MWERVVNTLPFIKDTLLMILNVLLIPFREQKSANINYTSLSILSGISVFFSQNSSLKISRLVYPSILTINIHESWCAD